MKEVESKHLTFFPGFDILPTSKDALNDALNDELEPARRKAPLVKLSLLSLAPVNTIQIVLLLRR